MKESSGWEHCLIWKPAFLLLRQTLGFSRTCISSRRINWAWMQVRPFSETSAKPQRGQEVDTPLFSGPWHRFSMYLFYLRTSKSKYFPSRCLEIPPLRLKHFRTLRPANINSALSSVNDFYRIPKKLCFSKVVCIWS